MTRWSRWCRPLLMVLVIVLGDAVFRPQTAWAWHGRCHVGAWCGGWGGAWGGCGPVVGFGPRFFPRPWCGPVVGPPVVGPGCFGWGGFSGGSRFGFAESISIGGPFGGFFSGTIRSGVIVPGWYGTGWCSPGWYGPWWGGSPWGCTPLPWGCGWRIGPPIVVSPFPAAIAPQFGPAGVLPFMGFAGGSPARGVAAVPRQPVVVAQAASARPAIAIRATNGDTRLRALRLVAVGDRHLRAAVADPRKLAAALDAYRRAAVIAPDLPDTFLRQAIVLAALDRDSDATRAIERAVAIDPRLGQAAADPAAVAERLPPDPVFGAAADPVDGTLASRTAGLLARIFATDGGRAAPAGANWIAARWSRALGVQPAAGDLDAVAAK